MLWRKGDSFAVDAVRSAGFDRPWSPAQAADTDRDEGLVLQPKRVPQDATPSEQDLQPDD